MGRKGNKKFIEKGEGQKFHLLHRSQRDSAYANEENPSDFVLVPAVEGNSNNQRMHRGDAADLSSFAKKVKGSHINELGFANDGYDYAQHLRDVDDTFFIPRAGVALDVETIRKRIELPEDAMPSQGAEMERNLEAITISHEFMDADIRAALFDETDNDGEAFEELQDDFVALAMQAPAEDDFDFDAHVARLIAQSERSLGIKASTLKGRKSGGRDSSVIKEGEDEEFDSDDDFPEDLVADMISQQPADDISRSAAKGSSRTTGRRKKSNHAVAPLSTERRAAMEAQFEDLLDEYADEEIGYMSEADSEDIAGSIDLAESGGEEDDEEDDEEDSDEEVDGNDGVGECGPQANEGNGIRAKRSSGTSVSSRSLASRSEYQTKVTAVLNEAMDEFLQQQKDTIFVEGVNLPKGVRIMPTTFAPDEQLNEPVNLKEANAEQLRLQQQSELHIVELEASARELKLSKEMETCQEYLKEERVQEEWDCETILSTYSTLDNHPTLIKAANGKFRPYKSRHARQMDAAASASSTSGSVHSAGQKHRIAQGSSSNSSSPGSIRESIGGSSSSIAAASTTAGGAQIASSKIVLSGKLGLPEGFGPDLYERRNDKKKERQERRDERRRERTCCRSAASVMGSIAPICEGDEENEEIDVVRDTNAGATGAVCRQHINGASTADEECKSRTSSNDDDADDEDQTLFTTLTSATGGRNKFETAEQKRLRKAITKEERRQKRESKREIKSLYKAEGAKLNRSNGVEQSIDHVSVFRYT